jgi:hypothetical protein
MNSTIRKKTGTVQKSLKSSDICRIIETCKSSGVSSFQLGSLHIQFGESFPEPKESWSDFTAKQTESGTQTTKVSHQSARKLSEEEIDQLKLTDPVSYERLILSGELDGTQL